MKFYLICGKLAKVTSANFASGQRYVIDRQQIMFSVNKIDPQIFSNLWIQYIYFHFTVDNFSMIFKKKR